TRQQQTRQSANNQTKDDVANQTNHFSSLLIFCFLPSRGLIELSLISVREPLHQATCTVTGKLWLSCYRLCALRISRISVSSVSSADGRAAGASTGLLIRLIALTIRKITKAMMRN